MYTQAVVQHTRGVGRTTTTLALAAALARRGRRVLAIGLDPAGDLSRRLGVEPGDGPTASELLRGRATVAEAARRTPHLGLERLRVIPAGDELATTEGWLRGRSRYDGALRERLWEARAGWDVAVVDCPPSLGPLTLGALVAADAAVVPTPCTADAVRGALTLEPLLSLVRELRNPQLALHAVVTRHRSSRPGEARTLASVRRQLGGQTSRVVIADDPNLSSTWERGELPCFALPDSRLTLGYEALALELEILAAGRCLESLAA